MVVVRSFFQIYALFSMNISISLIIYCITLCDEGLTEYKEQSLESKLYRA